MDKPTLRRELRALSRERLTDELRLTGSASIISQLRQHPLWQQAQHVTLYAALPDEPNLRTLIDEVATTKQVYLPRVLGLPPRPWQGLLRPLPQPLPTCQPYRRDLRPPPHRMPPP